MYKKLAKTEFPRFFEGLGNLGKVYGPVNIEGSTYEFREVQSPEEMDLKYTRTMIPPKKFFLGTILIGISCHPDEYCFCKSVGTSYATDGFDLFFHELSDGYFVRVGSEKGHQIIEANKPLFMDADEKDVEEFKMNEKKRLEEFNLELNVLGLQDMLDLAYESPVWQETADECFGCGTCNLTCPT